MSIVKSGTAGTWGLLRLWAMLWAVALALGAGPAWAGVGGDAKGTAPQDRGKPARYVLPASAEPLGISLKEVARETARFNLDPTQAPPVLPSKIRLLYINSDSAPSRHTVPAGTILYVPVLSITDAPPLLGDMPANVEKRRQLLRYWYSQSQIGMITNEIIVNGKAAPLDQAYLVGLDFTVHPLPGDVTQYAVIGAYVAGLPIGVHTIEIHFKATGDALLDFGGIIDVSFPYEVTVQ